MDLEWPDACVFSGRVDRYGIDERTSRALLGMARSTEEDNQEGGARSVPEIVELVHCEFLSRANTRSCCICRHRADRRPLKIRGSSMRFTMHFRQNAQL